MMMRRSSTAKVSIVWTVYNILNVPFKAVETPIEEGLKEEAYQLGQAMASTPAAKRFAYGKEKGIQDDLKTQKNWDKGVMEIQNIQ